MFKGLIKKLEEENLPANGTAIRDSIRDAGQAVMKQVKDKIEAAASASSSTVSSRTPSLIDIAPDAPTAGTSPQPPLDQSLVAELNVTRRERDGLLLRNSQLNNLISQMKAELSEERNLRRALEQEYKRPNEEIPFKVLLEKGSQTDCDPVSPAVILTHADVEQAAQDRVERDNLLLRNAELSHGMEQLKRQVSEGQAERQEIESELFHLKDQLLRLEAEHERLQKQQQQQPNHDTISLKEHEDVVHKLEEMISDKNKTIKLQLQRITDIKKSIQRGDVPPGSSSSSNHNNNASGFHPASIPAAGYFSDSESTRISASPLSFRRDTHSPPATLDVDSHLPVGDGSDHAATTLNVNFEYLKNVVFKFITSSEYESQKQLVKAIATLLQFTEQEEHSVRETLEWRASWFSSLPLVGPNLKPSTSSAPSSVKSLPPATHNRKSRKSTS